MLHRGNGGRKSIEQVSRIFERALRGQQFFVMKLFTQGHTVTTI